MYRILKSKFLSLNNLHQLSLRKTSNNPQNSLIGTGNLFKTNSTVLINGCLRQQSSTSNTQKIHSKPRKVRKKSAKRKYAELLVVTDKSTSEQKAKVKNLKPEDLKKLALSNLNLSELYKLKTFSSNRTLFEERTYHNLTVIENVPNTDNNLNESSVINQVSEVVKREETPNEENATQESSEIATINFTKIQYPAFEIELEEELVQECEDIKDKAHHVKPERKEMSSKAHQEVVNKTLAAYMDVCGSLNNPQKALNALWFHRSKTKKRPSLFPPITDVNVYNPILMAFGAKGDFGRLQEIIKYAREDNIEFNVQSYVAIFDCLARVNYKDSHLKFIRIYVKDALKQDINFDKILNEGIFRNDQKANVLNTMKAYDEKYLPNYYKPNLQYSNTLVNYLNHCDQLNRPVETAEQNSPLFEKKPFNTMIEEQVELEKLGYVLVKSIEARESPSQEVLKYRESLHNLFKKWKEDALVAFNRDLNALTARRGSITLEPYMRSIPLKDCVTIITDEAIKIAQGSETYSPTVNQLYKDLGNKVYARYKILCKQRTGAFDTMLKVHNKYCALYAAQHTNLDVLPFEEIKMNSRQQWQWMENLQISEGSSINIDHQVWVPTVLQNIGKFLYHIIMHDLKIDVNVMRNSKHKNMLPAFYTIFRHQGRLVKEEVKPHPILSKLYRASVPETLTFAANEIPMKCPPVPWISVHTGGYLISSCDVVRLPPQALAQKQRLEECCSTQIYPPLDSLNQLASVPWKVNCEILDVIMEVFQMGGSSKLDVPQPPSALDPPPPVTPDMDKKQKYENFKQRLQYRRKKSEMYSLWCDCLYRLSLANHFRDDIFWLPHNMDFRGRVYPIPPHLNHLGSDLARSILVFAESRPLGPNGLDWLKLHLVNLTGLKKREAISDRLIYANEIMDKILDSADNPLTGKMWWAEAEEPWQALACCMEIAKAHRSDNPEEYRSHFPVHQDGSCNGLQHYAALGRDSAGAHSVNLTPSRVPQDVYSAVAVLVEEKREEDAKAGLEIAKILEGFVKRKVIKQTVMTTVYGVTRFGARLQIARQLKDIENFPKEHVWAASSYLTGRTFDSLRTMFTSTKEIQDWFTECARLISSVCSENVEWITPLGLPVVQPYFKYKYINTNRFYESYHNDKYEKPNVMKQKNAFPPNFIHSLDSSHMMLTSLNCERAGITFVSVHDCYWTHASTVHLMNKICREQFVVLHSQPILENLSEFLVAAYSYNDDEFTDDGSVIDLTKRKLNKVLRQLPKTGNFDITQVLNSVYFFS